MPAASFVATGTYTGTGTSPLTLTRPAAVADDQLIALVWFFGQVGNHTYAAPAGWTLVSEVAGATGEYGVLRVFRRTMVAGDPTSWQWTFNNVSSAGGYIAVYRDVSTVAPVSASAGDAGDLTAPSVSPTSSGLLLGVWMAMNTSGNPAFTVTPPAGMTKRNTTDSLTLADAAVLPGATGTRTATASHSYDTPRAMLIALASSNVPPNAPNLVTPVGGVVVERTVTQRLDWDFSDENIADSQSKADVRYRDDGAASWTDVLGAATTSTFWDAPPSTFTAGDKEWQARTYDAMGEVGPWSASGFFTAATSPGVPTITDPVSGGTIAAETYTVQWSSANQDAYQLRTVADAAGVPDTATVYTDTGTVESSAARSRSVAFATNNRNEHIQVRVRVAGLWSSWASIRVLVSYTPPAAPTASIFSDDAAGSLAVIVTNPSPGAGEPPVTSHDIWRRETAVGGDGIRVATGVTAGGSWTDWTPASGVDYEFRVVSVGDNGTSSTSEWTGAAAAVITATVYGGGY